MERIAISERPGWREKATEFGFRFHTMHGEPYWCEDAYYQFTLAQIEQQDLRLTECKAGPEDQFQPRGGGLGNRSCSMMPQHTLNLLHQLRLDCGFHAIRTLSPR